MEIIPSLLTNNPQKFTQSLDALQGVSKTVQIDITDGMFVENKTLDDPELASQHAGKLSFELHLMVENPMEEIKKWQHISQVKRALFHIESEDVVRDTINAIHNYGWQAGIVLNPQTPADLIFPFLSMLDEVMLMSVHPGAQGQAFNPSVLSKVKEIKNKRPNIPVALDGGINIKTLPEIIKAGIDIICPGSAVFGNELTPRENILMMKKIVD
jgi:ribulose-phosphate 3-epimerase